MSKTLTAEQVARENIRRIQIAKLRKLTERRAQYFVPTGVGEELLGLLGSGKWFIVADFAANGTGKTTIGVNVLVNLMYGPQNDWFDYPLFKDWPYKKKARIISDPTTIRESIIPELHAWMPKGRYASSKGDKHYESIWDTDTGWHLDIMSNEQDVKEFESTTLGFCWLDEPPPQSIFKATVARMRKGGLIFVTATPLAGSEWMYDSIVTNTGNEEGQRTYVTADVESSCEEHGVRGYLKHADIQRIISQYTEDDMQARVHGLFQHLVGMVFKQWDRKVHVIRPFDVNPQDFCVIEAIDPHPRNPDAVLWVAIDKYGQRFVVDEMYQAVRGDDELAARIKKIAAQYRVVRRLGDPSMFIVDQHTQKSLATRLRAYGLSYLEATKARRTADRRIQSALNYQKKGEHIIRTPELYVFDHCVRTIFEMEHYRWDEWRGRTVDLKDPKGKPVDKDDHEIENLGRILIQEPAFIPYDPKVGMDIGQAPTGGMRDEDFEAYD